MKEIIIDLPKEFGNYRARWSYGERYPYNHWWCEIQREVEYKRWFKKKKKWRNEEEGWFADSFETRQELEKTAIGFYKEQIEAPIIAYKKAMAI